MGESAILEIFPVNGLDRSLHAPVFAGLLFITFFAETLGWTFAGLVVPGYFVSVILAAPATAVLVCVETVLTYFVCAALGKWIPRTQAWSTAFGRERFFLFILVALAVRLALEANLLPWLSTYYELPHSRELHSLGLVLVPLLANMFWNDGFVRSLWHVAVLIGLTFLVVDGVLLEYTNFTVSRFEVANESVSLQFLETPHAQFILLIGALIAARANVLYGWDYNGILVPALLSVAWYQPTKLLTTVVEALCVYGLARGTAALPPFNRVLLVGTRRTLLVFAVGFVVKWVGGFVAQWIDPTLHVIDFLGFGYLLPTLLATKMWNRNAIGTVIVPTIQVSIVAFVIGNLAGYALSALARDEAGVDPPAEVSSSYRSAATELMLASTAPSPDVGPAVVEPRIRLAMRLIDDLSDDRSVAPEVLHAATELGVRISATSDATGLSLTFGPQSADPDLDRGAPRFSVRTQPMRAAPLLVVAEASGAASPAIALAQRIARQLDARALVLVAPATPMEAFDRAFAARAAERLGVERALRVSLTSTGKPGVPHVTLGVVGELPEGIDMASLGELLGAPVAMRWDAPRAAPLVFRSALSLEVSASLAAEVAARELGTPPITRWHDGVTQALSEQLVGLTSTAPLAFEPPAIEELRLFRSALLPAVLALDRTRAPSAFERALAGQLGYHYVSVSAASADDDAGSESNLVAWGVYEPAGPTRRGHATWLRRVDGEPSPSQLLVEAPACRWESGTYRAALLLYTGYPADGLLLAGAAPTADAQGRADLRRTSGRRSFYHVIHEGFVDRGHRAVVVHGISAERDPGRDLVLSTGREVRGLAQLPAWAQEVADVFGAGGFDMAVFDGSLSLSAFEGGFDPALGYANRFAPDSTLLLWLSPGLRAQLVRLQEDHLTERRLSGLGQTPAPADVAALALAMTECTAGPCGALPAIANGCRADTVAAQLEAYTARRNPHLLRRALELGQGCRLRIARERSNDSLWALVADGERVFVVPLLGGPVRRAAAPVGDRRALELLLAGGLVSAEVARP